MRNGAVVRKWSPAAQRAKILAEYHSSGLTQREFAAQAGVSVGTLWNWLRKEGSQRTEEPVSFVEIPVAEPKSSASYKVRLPGGAVLEIPPGFAVSEVQTLLRLMRKL
jgi:transposase-like protein